MTDLLDHEWQLVEHLFEPHDERKTCGRPQASARAVLNAIRWIRHTRERWMYLPMHFPPQQTCYARYLHWKRNGVLAQVRALLTETRAGTSERGAPHEEADLIETA